MLLSHILVTLSVTMMSLGENSRMGKKNLVHMTFHLLIMLEAWYRGHTRIACFIYFLIVGKFRPEDYLIVWKEILVYLFVNKLISICCSCIILVKKYYALFGFDLVSIYILVVGLQGVLFIDRMTDDVLESIQSRLQVSIYKYWFRYRYISLD